MRRLRISKDLLIRPCLISFVAAMARMLRTPTIIAVILCPPSLDLARRKNACMCSNNVRTYKHYSDEHLKRSVLVRANVLRIR
ncbi:hypothetical protein F5888DRAFT_1660767 [Russula emetica]|nr:hypothetical protein F5888DRAFT_1660767 [Russula emetica]